MSNDSTSLAADPQPPIRYSVWLWRVLTWDSIVPIVLIGLPHAVDWLFPQALKVIEVMAILLPITAFFVRLVVGLQHIRTNHCSPWIRSFQQVFLFLGIFSLVVVDACLILQLNIPGAADRAEILAGFLLVTICFYLPCMVIAMYPGREAEETQQIGNWQVGR